MPRTISQRIQLEGGTEFRNALTALGQTAQQAFGSISQAVTQASTISTRLAPVIDSIQKKLTDLKGAASNVSESFSTLGFRFRETGTRFALLAGVVLGAQGGFVALIASAGKATEEIVKAAAAAGVTTDEWQKLAAVFKIAGIESSDVTGLFNKMNRSFGEQKKAALEVGKAQFDLGKEFLRGKLSAQEYLDKFNDLKTKADENINAFSRLGISAETALNNPREALLQTIDAFSKLPAGIEKSALEMELFGRNGTKLAIVANEGRAAFEKMEQQVARIAPPLTKLQIKIGNELDDAFDKVRLSAENTRTQFFLLFGPTATTLIDAITEAIVRNRGAILQFGQAVLTALDPLIQKATAFINAFVIDPSSFTGVTDAIASFARDVTQAAGIAVAAWNGFVAAMQVVADGINALFGTNLTGRALAFIAIIGVITGVFTAIAAAIGAVVAVVGFLIAAFGGVNLALAAVGIALGFIFGKLLIDAITNAGVVIDQIRAALIAGWTGTVANFTALWNNSINAVSERFTAFKDLVLSGIQAIIDAARTVASAFGFGSGSGDNAPGFAGGGRVRGRGTSTSDSIWARLSDGEFVMRTKAVQHYGVDFMSALNNMKIPSPAYAFGGLVSALDDLIPRTSFATGGLVTAAAGPTGRPVILKIGDQTFGPMSAPDDVITSLERFATGKQVRSAGRKPTWA